MGEVYLAEDTKLKREVAINSCPRICATIPSACAAFERKPRRPRS